jgi:hypothetical protein
MLAAQLKAQIEQTLPAAFTFYPREERGSLSTGIAQIDNAVGGVPLHALTEICGNRPGSPDDAVFVGWGGNMASSGKTSVLVSLLAQATRNHFCALVDASDGFDPASGQAAGIDFSRLLWVRCGKNRSFRKTRPSPNDTENRSKLPPLEQAFKVTDILLQSGGFGLIVADLSGISERIVRKIPLTTWFRFSRVIERQPAALVFVEQEPHATSCAGLVLRVASDPTVLKGNLFTQRNLNIEIVRNRNKKPVRSEKNNLREANFSFAENSSQNSLDTLEEMRFRKSSPPDFSPCLSASVVDVPLIPQGA